MKKAIFDTKWYWYIPLIGLRWLYSWSEFVFIPKTEIERGWRMIICDLIVLYQTFWIIYFLLYFKILPL